MLNNFTKYNSTHLVLIEILYEFKVKEPLNLIKTEGLDLNDLINDIDSTSQQASQQATTTQAATQPTATTDTSATPQPATPQRTSPATIPTTEQRAITIRVPLPKVTTQTTPPATKQRAITIRIPMPKATTRKSSARAMITAIDAFPSDQSEPTYRPEHIDAQDALAFASIRIKEYYDAKHKPMFFKVDDHVHLRLHRGYQMADVQSRKLDQQFAGSFEIVKRIGRLVYRLKLPPTMKIHNREV